MEVFTLCARCGKEYCSHACALCRETKPTFKTLDCCYRNQGIRYFCDPECWMTLTHRRFEDVSWNAVKDFYEQRLAQGHMTALQMCEIQRKFIQKNSDESEN